MTYINGHNILSLFLAVRNDRKKKTVNGESKDSSNNNNTSSKPAEMASQLTEKDRELIETILDIHRSTLPGGPILLVTVSHLPRLLAPPL